MEKNETSLMFIKMCHINGPLISEVQSFGRSCGAKPIFGLWMSISVQSSGKGHRSRTSDMPPLFMSNTHTHTKSPALFMVTQHRHSYIILLTSFSLQSLNGDWLHCPTSAKFGLIWFGVMVDMYHVLVD